LTSKALQTNQEDHYCIS